MKVINTKGLTAEVAVRKIREAIEIGENTFLILADDKKTASVIAMFLKGQSLSFSMRDDNGTICIETNKSSDKVTLYAKTRKENSLSSKYMLLASEKIGPYEDDFGRHLLMSFLEALTKTELLPKYIILMNEAVKMSTKESPFVRLLKTLERRGIKILICQSSIKQFNVEEQVVTGSISDIQEIAETMLSSSGSLTVS